MGGVLGAELGVDVEGVGAVEADVASWAGSSLEIA